MAKTAVFTKYLFLGFIVLTGGIVSTADAFDWFVPTDFPTIQDALNSPTVTDSNIITVIGNSAIPPVYFEHDIDFNGKNVRVQTGNAMGFYIRRAAIIDCQYQGRAFIFQSGETNSARLVGFIIRNGYAEDTSWPQDPSVDASGYGGAIYIKNSTPIITQCDIYNCTADAGGGAIFCDEDGDAEISNCYIGFGSGSYNFAGWGFYRYVDPCDPCAFDLLDANDLHQLGGGIYCKNSSPLINSCFILWNTAAGSGGGIACEGSNANIRFCFIEENDAFVDDDRIDQHGGGIYIKDCKGSGPVIWRCFPQVNTARWSGGGIAVIDSNALIDLCDLYDNHCWASAGGIYSQGNPHSDPNTDPNKPNTIIRNTSIVFNWGYWSGGVSSNYGSSMTFVGSTITRNVASYSWLVGGLEAYGGSADGNGVIIWDNIGVEQQSATAGVSASAMGMEFGGLEMASFGVNPSINFCYSNIQMFDSEGFYDPNAVWPGEGNINKDPMFVNPNRRPYDFHLQSTSPCINAGDPFADYSLEPAPNGGRINIGVYGGTDEATSSDILRPVPTDADADLEVNMVDFAILADNWGLEGTSIQNKKADADNNNIVDARDLAILHKFWLWQQNIYDPSDLEANNQAVSKEYTAIPGKVFSQEEWESVRKSRSTKPAGKVFPTPKLQCSPDGIPLISEDQLTEKQKKVLVFSKALAKKIMGVDITAEIYRLSNKARAAYGDRELSFNLNRLGKSFFEKFPTNMEKVLDLLIHEFGHEYASNHLSDEYSRALTSLGAKTAMLALKEPEFFKRD